MSKTKTIFYGFGAVILLLLLFSCGKDDQTQTTKKDYRKVREYQQPVEAKQFFFVGLWRGKECLYRYDLKDSSYSLFWKGDRERVIELSYSDDFRYAFFVTVRKMGIKRGVAFINGIKLYRLDPVSSTVELVSDIGNGIQLLVQWNEINFELQLTRFDMKIASQINKVNQIYSPFGKLLKEEVEKYDFIKEGYPVFTIRKMRLVSPSAKFGLAVKNDSLLFKIAGFDEDVYIDSAKQTEIKKVKWIDNENYVIFSTKTVIETEKEKITVPLIYVYDVVHRELLSKHTGEGRMNFIIAGDLLIFDTGVGKKSVIKIVNFKKNTEATEVKIYGGCSLSSIII